MGFLTHRIAASVAGRRYRNDVRGMREAPERIVLGVREGETPNGRPPVRIFLGTEPGQARAERVFFWSVEQVRDPARVYEIHLMKDLAGFRRQFWLTGFTNYRFAIPHFAGGTGRAIYNDVDQIYLKDPAVLFDTEMGRHGFLSVLDTDTSVMLMDCGRMVGLWPLEAARTRHRKSLEAAAREVPELWGPLHAAWNARDEEYAPGVTGVLHFTTLHTQPWRPFPDEYVYRPNPVGEVWHALERSAEAAGYHPFSAEQPSAGYHRLVSAANRLGSAEEADAAAIGELLRTDRSDVGTIAAHRPGTSPPAGDDRADTAVALDWLDLVPDEDLGWTLDRLFSAASRNVAIRVAAHDREIDGGAGRIGNRVRSPERWREAVSATAMRYPRIRWALVVETSDRRGAEALRRFDGGRGHDAPAEVWVVASDKPGHTSQAVGLTQAMGWRYELRSPKPTLADQFSLLLGLPAAPFGGRGLASLGTDWPGAVVASGWLAARVARWIEKRSRGRTRAVLLGRKGGAPRSPGEIVVTCRHYGLPEHPRRVQVALPPHPVTSERLARAAARRPDLLAGAASPRTVVLVGGSSRSHRLDEQAAGRLGGAVAKAVEDRGGSLFVVTSRRTGEAATARLRESVEGRGYVYAWRPDEADNPYLAYLALADVLVVTGESESMIAEAVASGKPVYVYPIDETPPNPWQRLAARIAGIAERPRLNKRGTVRPQQGLEYLCARLIERGWILPPRNLSTLHRVLVDRGVVRLFEGRIDLWNPPALNATGDAAATVRALLGYARPGAATGDRKEFGALPAGDASYAD